MKSLSIIITLLTIFTTSLSAQQYYVSGGGNYSIYTDENASVTTSFARKQYSFDFSTGYFLDSNWAVGLAVNRLGNKEVDFNSINYNSSINDFDTLDLTDRYKVSMAGVSVRRFWNVARRVRSYVHLSYVRGQGYTQNETYNSNLPNKIEVNPYSSRNERGDMNAGLAYFLTKRTVVEVTMPLAIWQKQITRVNMPNQNTTSNFATILNSGISINSLRIGLAVFF